METAHSAPATAKAGSANFAEAVRTVCASAPDLIELSAPLESLLTAGGDPRLNVDPVRLLNRYSCRSWPNPEALLFASSTASNISERGFAAAATGRQRLLRATRLTDLANACQREAERLRDAIRTIWRLERSGVDIVFSPSGTDSEVHALYVAQAVLGGPLVNVIVAADETGSGVGEAARGRHFSSSTAQGEAVSKGERIPGFAADISNISIPLREKDGKLRSHSTIDEAVTAAVAESAAAGKSVVLHVMDSSKFGWSGPSSECVRQIRKRWGHSVQVVVDACQMRLSRPRLAAYLSQGSMVLITGSKYFAGPPFSGALFVPPNVSALMERIDSIPDGLRLYTNSNDWPVRWRGVRANLPSRPNVGQLLRWCAAVEEMKAYFAVPESYRLPALQVFASTVEQLIAARPNLEPLPACEGAAPQAFGVGPLAPDGLAGQEIEPRTIFPFFVRRQGKRLSVDDCTRIYRSLHCDMTNLLSQPASIAHQQMAMASCHIGQTVPVPDEMQGVVGTLRISASARVVSETWRTSGETESFKELNRRLDQVRLILDKIDLLVENLDALSPAAG